MTVRTSGDLGRFRSRVEALVHRHPVVVDNAYTRWFATGPPTATRSATSPSSSPSSATCSSRPSSAR